MWYFFANRALVKEKKEKNKGTLPSLAGDHLPSASSNNHLSLGLQGVLTLTPQA